MLVIYDMAEEQSKTPSVKYWIADTGMRPMESRRGSGLFL